MPIPEYPSNSRTAPKQEAKAETPELKKVVEGKVVVRKRPLHKRLLETFVGTDDAAGVFEYVIKDVIVPATKDVISDAITTTVERMLFGEASPRSRRRNGAGGSRVAYSGFSRTMRRDEEPRREMSSRARAQHDFSEVVLETRADAEAVLSDMYEHLSRYDLVTLKNFYDLVGQSSSPQDTRWGWEGPGSLQGSRVIRISGGYLIDLPRPEPVG